MPNDADARRAGPFQFTLRTMFIATTVVAIAMGGLCAPITGVQSLAILYLSILIPALLTVTVIYGRGYVRTFTIGALFPAGVALFCALLITLDDVFDPSKFLTERESAPAMVLAVACAIALIVVAGLAAVGMRWMVESPRAPASPKPTPEVRTDQQDVEEPLRA